MMIRNIHLFLVTLGSLFSSAHPYVPTKLSNPYQNKESKLNNRIPNKDTSIDKICSQCKHFNANDKTCKLFYELDLVDGREYEKAIDARRSVNKCGVDGRYYEKDKIIIFKKIGKILLQEWYPLILTGVYVCLYVYIMSYKYK